MGGAIPVDLPKKMGGENLEQACLKAAAEIGYKARSVDEYKKRYSLGSLHEHRDYGETCIKVGNLIPAFRVVGIIKDREQTRFFLWTGFPHGFASSRQIETYLSVLSKYL